MRKDIFSVAVERKINHPPPSLLTLQILLLKIDPLADSYRYY